MRLQWGLFPSCNLEYPDEYDLAKLTGVDILFISKKGQCYVLSHGDRSVVPVYDGPAIRWPSKTNRKFNYCKSFWRKFGRS